ncbi:hypothetical protein [Dongshaea marina]|uniref:hypothetical protein n=1 Tax=Dongshaea marina TaxID=2047966 RepID=UPI00131EDAA1|nr:hypothetical protein [Dongshaea marina]
MLNRSTYELLPYIYLVAGAGLILSKQNIVFTIAGIILYLAGSIVWIMRSNHRRTNPDQRPRRVFFFPRGSMSSIHF